tara:strand:+ start:531 stop:1379 length:849 start_codon:yes stop_codon:yes gene_type:complete
MEVLEKIHLEATEDRVINALENIVNETNELLKGLPFTWEAYTLLPDGGWVSREKDLAPQTRAPAHGAKPVASEHWEPEVLPVDQWTQENREVLLASFSSTEEIPIRRGMPGWGVDGALIEDLSPEEWAWFAREAAILALEAVKTGDLYAAVDAAMRATNNHRDMQFAMNYERDVAAWRASQDNKSETGRKEKAWAKELAEMLVRSHPTAQHMERWRLIPEAGDRAIEIMGVSIYRGEGERGEERVYGDDIITGHPESLSFGSFKKKYLAPANRTHGKKKEKK